MNRLGALIRVNFLALLKQFSTSKKKVSGVGSLFFMFALCIYMSGIYSWLFAQSLAPAGLLNFLPMLMSVFACAMALMLTVFAASGIVFGGKDNDFVLALPISVFEILLSKIMALYLQNMLIIMFIMLPCGVIYALNGGVGGFLAIILMFIGSIFLAFIPTLIGVILGYVISWFSSKVEKKSLITSIMYVAFFVVIMGLSFQMNGFIANIVSNSAGLEEVFYGYLLPFGLLGSLVMGNFSSLILLVLISIVPFLIVVWFLSKNYKKIVTNMNSHVSRSDFKLSKIESTSQFKALLKKEISRYFGTPMYLLNSGFGIVLLLGGCILALFNVDTINAVLILLGGMNPLPIVFAFIAFTVATVNTTCVSISLEGDRLWILKEAPISAKNIFNSKIALNLLVIVPAVLISTLMLAIVLSLNILQILLVIAFSLALAVFVAHFGLVVNLTLPKLDAENEVIVIKQSASSLIGIMGVMIMVIGVAALYGILLSSIMSFETFIVIITFILALASYLLARYLHTIGRKIFERL